MQLNLRKMVKTLPSLIRLGASITWSKLARKRTPIIVSLHVTNRCNMRCKYCYSNPNNRFDTPSRDFSTRELFNLVNNLHDMGTRWIVLLGGEPLLRDDIGALIQHIKKKNMLCELVTNGTLLAQRLDDVKNVDLTCVSLDGPKAVNDLMRGKGTYQKTIQGLNAVTRAGIPTRVHAVVTKQSANIDTINHLAAIARRHGTTFGFSSPIPSGMPGESSFLLDMDGMKSFWKMVLDCKRRGYPVYNTVSAMEYIIQWPSQQHVMPKKEILESQGAGWQVKACHAGDRAMYIDSEGIVYPCICKGIHNGLNYKNVGLQAAWEHLASTQCGSCAYIQYVEFNDIVNIRTNSILLGLQTFFGRR
ncbi:radical SAM protein [Candidatus Bathyarchaeota archaeon]|nr:radical SAM protein [Candidatus Bathyarchaeota archaeon]